LWIWKAYKEESPTEARNMRIFYVQYIHMHTKVIKHTENAGFVLHLNLEIKNVVT